MAVRQSRRGYGWSLPGLAAARPGPGGRGTSQIRIFSSRGTSAPGVLGTSPLLQIGFLIPGTPYVYVRPRLSQDEGLGGGGGGSQFSYYQFPYESSRKIPVRGNQDSVHITNSLYNFYRRNERTRSIGAAGAGSVGRNMDVAFQNDVPFFHVP
jgi:hypothetical protein